MADSIVVRIDQCRAKLSQLKKRYDDSPYKSRYAREKVRSGLKISIPYHPFELNACLDEATLARFEERCRIQLPAEFRLALLHLGNGGGRFWDELIPSGYQQDAFYEWDYLRLENYWPTEVLLCIRGERVNQVYLFTDGHPDGEMLANSFLDWFEHRLDKASEELSRLLAEREQRNAVSVEALSTEELIKAFCSFDGYEKKKQEALIDKITDLVKGQCLSEDQYQSLIDKAFTGHLHALQVLIGETLLDHYRQKRIELSKRLLVKFLELTGLGYMNLKDLKAVELLLESILLSGNTFHYANISKTYLLLERFSEALMYIDKAPVTFYTIHIKGCIYQEMGDIETAISYFLQSIRLYNTYSESYKSLGDCYLAKRQYELASACYRDAVNKCHDSGTGLLTNLARSYALANNGKDCENVLAIMIEKGLADQVGELKNEAAFAGIV